MAVSKIILLSGVGLKGAVEVAERGLRHFAVRRSFVSVLRKLCLIGKRRRHLSGGGTRFFLLRRFPCHAVSHASSLLGLVCWHVYLCESTTWALHLDLS